MLDSKRSKYSRFSLGNVPEKKDHVDQSGFGLIFQGESIVWSLMVEQSSNCGENLVSHCLKQQKEDSSYIS